MVIVSRSFAATVAVFCSSGLAFAHPGHSYRQSNEAGATDASSSRIATSLERVWTASTGAFSERGSFVMAHDDTVQIRRADDSLVTLPRALLRSDDQRWVVRRMAEIRRQAERAGMVPPASPHQRDVIDLRGLVTGALSRFSAGGLGGNPDDAPLPFLLAQRSSAAKEPTVGNPPVPEMANSFEPFVKLKAIKTRWDDRWFYVESNGIPDHPMMVGITSWQQQVPLPQKYTGENAWQIPLHPVPAKTPATTKNRFLRGAIAVAVNGIPIFNPLNNRGDDAYLFGELDEFGGHCGRADDYHYHLAPVHLEKTVGKGKPIAYAFDGYPIYGYEEPDGSPVKNLDALNGHRDANGTYHYHATKTYPYLNGGFYGEVTERGGQVDPQPRAEPVRPDLRPLRDAKITGFRETKPKSYLLTYDIRGKKGTVGYTLNEDATVRFTFTDIDGKSTTETYSPRRRGPGRPEDEERRPQRPGEKRPPRRGDRPPTRDDNLPPPRDAERGSERGDDSQKPRPNLPRLIVTSASLDAEGNLPVECSCDGAGASPAVEWKNVPAGTKSFALSLWHVAPDQEKSYWVVYNVPADVTKLAKNSKNVGRIGLNDKRKNDYDPMCSKGPGQKTYHITVWALSSELSLPAGKATRAELLDAIRNLAVAEGTLDFRYERKK